jgi:predicted NBD/HSP70 family sugar kinase
MNPSIAQSPIPNQSSICNRNLQWTVVHYAGAMRILVVDVGGSHVKLLVTGATEPRRFDSGPGFTPQQLVAGVKTHAADWRYDVAAIGVPSPVLRGGVMEEPWNLGRGWVGFDFEAALGVPTTHHQ